MAHAFWKNLSQLISGEPHEPGDGRDERGIRYLFGSAGFLNEGRRLFDLAECLSHNFDAIQERTTAFLVSEWKKTGSVEDGPAKIVTFTQAVDDFEEPHIFAYLNEVEPDFDNLLYGYWDVELKNFTPVRYGGVVSTISKIPSGYA